MIDCGPEVPGPGRGLSVVEATPGLGSTGTCRCYWGARMLQAALDGKRWAIHLMRVKDCLTYVHDFDLDMIYIRRSRIKHDQCMILVGQSC